MKALLDDLLDVTRTRFGRLALRRQATDLDSVVRDVVEPARPAIERAGICSTRRSS